MELLYHICGHPIRVRATGEGRVRPLYFDGSHTWNEGALRRCPGCGGRLHMDALVAAAGVTTTLRSWLADWPRLRRTLESKLTAYQQHDPATYPYHAERDLAEFDLYLQRVAEIAAAVEQHGRRATPPEPHGEHARVRRRSP